MKNFKLWFISVVLVPVACIALIILIIAVGLITDWIEMVGNAVIANTPAVLGWVFPLVLILLIIRFSGLPEIILRIFSRDKRE